MANEKRLIDANALIKEACAEGTYGYVDAKQIADAPTIDAVEVVRCRDCNHCDPENYHCDHPMGTVAPLRRKPDDFCSYGERKDGDGNAHLTDLKQAEKLYGCSKAAFDDCFGEEPDNA